MKIKKNVTMNFTPTALKQIILDYLKKDGYIVKTSDINFHVDTEYRGDDMTGREVIIFKGCSVNCNKK